MAKGHGRSVHTEQQTMIRRKRMARVEQMLLHGVTSKQLMASRLGCTDTTICNDLKLIRSQWMEDDIRKSRERRSEYIRKFHYAAQLAMTAFERSQQCTEEITTVYTPRTCPECKGKGMDPNNDEKWCGNCRGKGKILVETVTRKVKGQPGDPAFLRVYKECMTESARIENMYPHAKIVDRSRNSLQIVNKTNWNVDFKAIPQETLLEARQVLAQLLKYRDGSRVIDVTSSEPKLLEEDES